MAHFQLHGVPSSVALIKWASAPSPKRGNGSKWRNEASGNKVPTEINNARASQMWQ